MIDPLLVHEDSYWLLRRPHRDGAKRTIVELPWLELKGNGIKQLFGEDLLKGRISLVMPLPSTCRGSLGFLLSLFSLC